ncbi:hypothetical protein ACP70R_029152 [Stipagrostis hirtigluma subsp. patula]
MDWVHARPPGPPEAGGVSEACSCVEFGSSRVTCTGWSDESICESGSSPSGVSVSESSGRFESSGPAQAQALMAGCGVSKGGSGLGEKRPRWGFTRAHGSGSPADERWDLRKKRVKAGPADEESKAKSAELASAKKQAIESDAGLYAGPSFQYAAPEPAKLPIPVFLVLPRYVEA